MGPKKLDVWCDEIITLYQLGNVKEALQLTDQALIEFPDQSKLLGYAGTFSMVVEDLQAAYDFYRKSLGINPKNADVLNNLASLLVKQNRFDEAEETYRNALMVRPEFVEVYNNLGNLLEQLKRYQEAEVCFTQALELNPNYAEVYNNWGNLRVKQNKYAEAELFFKKALEICPDYADAYNNLGNLFYEQKHLVKAEKSLQIALKLRPNYTEAYINLGCVYKELMRYKEARRAFKHALKLQPDCAEAYNNLGGLLMMEGRYEDAVDFFYKALALRENFIDVEFRLSLALLMLGQFLEGWKTYEVRYHPEKKNRQTFPPEIDVPRWQGENLTNKSLLIWPEQGLGDEIQFVRYLLLLKTYKPKELILVCKKPLKKLFSRIECVDRVIALNDFEIKDATKIDYWSFIMSFPHLFQTRLEAIPAQVPYLYTKKSEQIKWAEFLPKDSFCVGLVWKGNKQHKNDSNRSLSSLDILKPLWDIKDVVFVSLQKGAGEDEAESAAKKGELIHFGDKIQDFTDTAAIISQLDLVICVDTAIAHLTGALNKPCWVLLPESDTDCRWLLERDDSPWYPDVMRLFRQKKAGDWESVVSNVVRALKKKLA